MKIIYQSFLVTGIRESLQTCDDFLADIFSRHAILHKFVTINKSGRKSR